MYHLRENRLVQCIRPFTYAEEPLLINGMTIPIGTTGSMSITATSVNEFNFEGSIRETFNVTASETILKDWSFDIDKPFIDTNGDTVTIYCRNEDWETGARTVSFTSANATITAVGGTTSTSPSISPSGHMGYFQVKLTNITGPVVMTVTSI